MYFIVDMVWEIIDFGTFSGKIIQESDPSSGGCWPLFALGLDRIKWYGGGCSGQMLNTDACA